MQTLTKLAPRIKLICNHSLLRRVLSCQTRNINRNLNLKLPVGRTFSWTTRSMVDQEPTALLMDDLPADFDKEQFKQNIKVKALKIPAKQCQLYMKLLNKHLLNKPRLRNVLDDPDDPSKRLLLLEEGLNPADFRERTVVVDSSVPPLTVSQIIDRDGLEVADASVELDYRHVSATAALRRLIPDIPEVPSSFEQIGHIAHLNLRDELRPYRFIIGTVLLDKNPKLKTVVNKIGSIENEWRVFSMELLAGKDDMIAEVRQHGARFRLDFKKVYWNSRLEAEHLRLVERWFKEGEVVADAMSGIGPFAIPAGRRGCRVLANDLNPDSYKWLVENIKINKVAGAVTAYNLDGRDFLRRVSQGNLQLPETTTSAVKDSAADQACSCAPPCDHVVMNLPAAAVEFLDALPGAFNLDLWAERKLPMVHVYAFLKADEGVVDLQKRIETALGVPLEKSPEFHSVRDVAPNKQMYCASFRVPSVLLDLDRKALTPGSKRQKT